MIIVHATIYTNIYINANNSDDNVDCDDGNHRLHLLSSTRLSFLRHYAWKMAIVELSLSGDKQSSSRDKKIVAEDTRIFNAKIITSAPRSL